MSVLTARGASSSSMNLMNSSTRFPEGAGMQNPRTGKDLSAGFSAADRDKVAASSQQSHGNFDFPFMFSISAIQKSVSSPGLRCADQLRAGRTCRFLRIFRLNDLAHELCRKLGVLVREFDADSFAVHHGQLMAQFVAGVAVISDLVHCPREVAIVLVCFACNDSIDSVYTRDAAIRVAVKLPAEV